MSGGRVRRKRKATLTIGLAIAALGLAGCLGPGVAVSNKTPGYARGLWRSLGGESCYWARLRSFTGDPHQDVIASVQAFPRQRFFGPNPTGPQLVQIDASDAGFAQSDCIPFWRQDPPGPYARFLVQGQSFGPGDFLVGPEIQPGTYTFTPFLEFITVRNPTCRWARLRGFHHTADDETETGTGTPGQLSTVTIQPGDVGFTSFQCGTFTKVS